MKKDKKGFTLLELLIVIAILAVLGAMVIFLLNPAETLRKARDSQRISDLSTIKTALGIYLVSKKTPQLDGVSGTVNDKCVGGATPTLFYSVPAITGQIITDITFASGAFATSSQATSIATVGIPDGSSGWIKTNLNSLSGGSPISNFPIDPTNDVTTGTSTVSVVNSSALVYRFACKKSPLGFEVNATLESDAYTLSTEEDLDAKDGGNNAAYYEAGTDLTILTGASTDF
ncbi:MAG: type II secretion system protein [Patescibacteria group bacterium]